MPERGQSPPFIQALAFWQFFAMPRELRIECEGAMTLAWMARRLRMGAWTHASNLLGAAQ